MNKNLLYIFCILILILPSRIYAQSAPELISPADNSEFQNTINLELRWEDLSAGSVYEVQYSSDSLFANLIGNISLSGSRLVIAQLLHNTIYYWRVRVSGEVEWSEVWNFKTTGLPITPVVFSPQNNIRNRETELLFNWSSAEVNKKYFLQVSDDSLFLGEVLNFITNDTFYVVQNLENNTNYFWRVRGLNIDNTESGWSEIFHFKTKLANVVFAAPSNNSINRDTSLTFIWGIAPGSSSYNFQLAIDSLFTDSSLVINVDTVSNQLLINSLEYNTRYYWRAASSNAVGDSSNWSDVLTIKTKLRYPELISPADSLRNRDTTEIFLWNSIESADEYIFQLAVDSLFVTTILNTTIADTSIEIDSLKFNQKYFWRVTGKNSFGDMSDWKKFNFKTLLELPVLLSPSDSSKNMLNIINLVWNNISSADSYFVQISYDSLFKNLFTEKITTDSLFKTDSLLFDTTYYWRTLGFNAEGDSSRWTNEFSFKTRPAILFSTEIISDTVNLSVKRADTLTTLSISNYGSNPFVIDSIKIQPDSLFSIDKSSSTILPEEEEDFKIKFNAALIDTGLTEGIVHFIRSNSLISNDTLSVIFKLLIRKAAATFSDSSLAFDSVDAISKSIQTVIVGNKGGNINLQVDSIRIIGSDTSAFKIINDSLLIKSNDSTFFSVEFKPQRLGYHSASLVINTNSYPDTILIFPLSGYGKGGELFPSTLSRISELSDSLFEAFTDNDKPITFKNIGNAPLDVSIEFAQDNFKLANDFQNNFIVKRGDSASIKIKYMIPDFEESNKDTMRIIHNGFGEDTLSIYLEGSFDSLASAKKIQSELRLNGNLFAENDLILNENTPLNFTLNPDILNSYPHLRFRIKYFNGGHGSVHTAENDGSFNYEIPNWLLNERGLLISGQMLVNGKNNKILDSILLFKPISVQTILKNYKTVDIGIPKSQAAEKPENANVKWIMFGFPFEEIIADTLFKELGGIENMKDGEWIIYKYDLSAPDSFSIFNGYSLQPNTAYFAAQSLKDTFKISYTYKENLRTRKLTDTIMNVPGTNWKTISNPFLFDVEVEPSVILRRYDTNNKIYKMTNIMKPGEGYFVEPSVSQIRLKTFGEYNPLFYPAIISEIGWHVKAAASNKNAEVENLFSISNKGIAKSAALLPKEYASAPRLQKGLNMYIENSRNEKIEVSVKENSDGAVWDLILLNDLSDDFVNLNFKAQGNFPENFNFKIFNDESKDIEEDSLYNYFIKKNKPYKFKLITGTDTFIKKTIESLTNQIPETFSISQNYPNPFNPVTTINYQFPENSFVSIKIYDALGAEVATLVNTEKSAGYYKVNFNAERFASGVYFYRIIASQINGSANNFIQTKKMILLK